MCSRHQLVPESMHIPDCSKSSVEVSHGGSADVLRGTYQGHQVAIKVVRVYIASDLDIILSVSFIFNLHCYTGMDELVAAILPRGSHLEVPSTSKYPTTGWSDDKRTPVYNGF